VEQPDRRTAYAKALGQNIRDARNALGMSLQVFEDHTDGVWKAVVVGSYERGERAITVLRLALLAAALGTTPAALLPDVAF